MHFQRFLAILLGIFLLIFTGVLGISFFVYPTLVTEKMKVDALWIPAQKSLLTRVEIVDRAIDTLAAEPDKTAIAAARDKILRAQVREDFAPDLPEQFAFYVQAQNEFAALAEKALAQPTTPDPVRAEYTALQPKLLAEEQTYDAAALPYNEMLKKWPNSLVATVFKFLPKGTFVGAQPPVHP